MKSDINGNSQCTAGSENFESFKSTATGRTMYQYDYRTADGRLFSTVSPDLDVCRKRRDAWMKGKKT
jgi:hypothetical protein